MGRLFQLGLAAVIVAALGGVSSEAANAKGCTCKANGSDYELGQIVCIRGRLAQCQMNLNNSSWSFIADTCPESRSVAPSVYASLAQPKPVLQSFRQ